NRSTSQSGSAIYVDGGVSRLTIEGNTLSDGVRGIRFAQEFGNGPITDVTLSGNTITGMTEAGIVVDENADLELGSLTVDGTTFADNADDVLPRSVSSAAGTVAFPGMGPD